MSDCYRTRDLAGPYLYGDLAQSERAAVEAHLRVCARCRSEFSASEALLRGLPRTLLMPSPEATERIIETAKLGLPRDAPAAADTRRPIPGAFRLALTAAVALAIGVWAGQWLPHQSREDQAGRARPTIASPVRPDRALPRVDGDQAPQTLTSVHPHRSAERAVGARQDRILHADSTASPRVAAPPAPVLYAPRPQGVDDVQLAQTATEMTP